MEEGGNELAKVLWYYNLIPDVSEAEQKIVCPFHDDVNPSMIINLDKGTWYCFGCNTYGGARKFVSMMEDKYHGMNDLMSYKMYLKILKSKKCSNIKLSKNMKHSKKKPNGQAYVEAYDYYHGLSKVDWREDIDAEEFQKAKQYMQKRGFTSISLNAVKAKVNYSYSYGLIFPILDNKKFKGWVCRTMIKEVEEKRKYLYNEGFRRATTLCGDYGNKDYVILVEGFMDRLKFIEYGVEPDNVAAVLGWKISAEQERKLKEKGIKNIISALDNDKCGKKGTKYLKTIFNVTRFQYLKGIKDPGEMTEEQLKKCYRRTMEKYKLSVKENN
jgi:DNA primase